jgi:Uma2 family endonuclease
MDRPNRDMQTARAEPIRYTYEDYLTFPDDGRRHELIDGEHFVTPAPVRRHQKLSGRLLFALEAWLRAHPVGEVYAAPLDVILSDVDVVEPDLLFVSNERAEILGKWVHGAPDLVIEILSPGTRRTDEVAKRHLYERVGVREYWIVDGEIDVVKVYRRQEDGTFPRVADLCREEGHSLDTPLLPGFSLLLAELFA